MRLLLDEMYPSDLTGALVEAGIDSVTVAGLGLAGASDFDVFAAAVADERALLTENVADFVRIAADHLGAGRHCSGVLIALSTRFSRRPTGREPLVAAIRAVAQEPLEDRIVYLRHPDPFG